MKYLSLSAVALLTMYLSAMEESAQIITVQQMIKNVRAYAEKKDYPQTLQWFHRFELLCSADWKSLSIEQIEKYQEVYSEFFDAINNLRPASLQQKRYSEIDEIEWPLKLQEAAWLRNMIENDKCCGLEWREAFGKTSNDKPMLSSETLKKKRLYELSQIGTIQTMGQN